MTDATALLFDTPEEGVRRITFNRPDRLNAFNAEMYDGLLDELDRLQFDETIRVVIITGSGRGFCSGNERAGMGTLRNMPENVGVMQTSRYSMLTLARIPLALRSLPQPVIAAVNGSAAGLGYALALCADIAVAAESAKFVNAIHNAGTGCELGLSYLLPRAVGTQKAAELLLTMRPVPGREAERIGLVLKCVPDAELMDEALGLARDIMVNVPIGQWMTKQALWMNQAAGSLEAAMEFEHRGVYISQRTEDAAEKRKSSIEKRSPQFHNR